LSFKLLSEVNSKCFQLCPEAAIVKEKTDVASKFQGYAEYLRWQHTELLGAAPWVNGDCVTSFLVNDFGLDLQRDLTNAASQNAQFRCRSLRGSRISNLFFPSYTILRRKQAISCISDTKIS